MSARESVVQALVNVGYGKRQAEELLSLALGEAQQAGFESGRCAAAEDFRKHGETHDTLSWGQAYYIARDGLNGGAR
ncbi:hypothetical protein ACIGO8_08340 [Streptomyces sp. NPDC053493]|uniref:hypothetical protein n=1 Tax=Streptomyces sp. NPDC053493 TaxID=3365705 RepID=UPI0037D0617E